NSLGSWLKYSERSTAMGRNQLLHKASNGWPPAATRSTPSSKGVRHCVYAAVRRKHVFRQSVEMRVTPSKIVIVMSALKYGESETLRHCRHNIRGFQPPGNSLPTKVEADMRWNFGRNAFGESCIFRCSRAHASPRSTERYLRALENARTPNSIMRGCYGPCRIIPDRPPSPIPSIRYQLSASPPPVTSRRQQPMPRREKAQSGEHTQAPRAPTRTYLTISRPRTLPISHFKPRPRKSNYRQGIVRSKQWRTSGVAISRRQAEPLKFSLCLYTIGFIAIAGRYRIPRRLQTSRAIHAGRSPRRLA
ncbi:unnamed protein product, partial [Nesidiocoris tenuis]